MELSNIPFAKSQVYTTSNYNNGSFIYDVVATIKFSYNDNEEIELRIKQVAESLIDDPISIDDITAFIFNLAEYSKYRKLYFEKLDQNRKIVNGAYSAVTCKYCKKNQVFANVVQNRGSDEPGTQFVNCLNPDCLKIYKHSE